MTVLRIENISCYGAFELKEVSSGKTIRLVIEFHNVRPQISDYLILSQNVLDSSNKNYCGFLCFTSDLNDTCGRRIENVRIDEDGDIAILINNHSGVVLKRLYG